MKPTLPRPRLALPLMAALALLAAAPAQAACFVTYKAKMDSPLRLHYGVMELAGDAECPPKGKARRAAEKRLKDAGWTLLTLEGLSSTPPGEEEIDNAGEFYLRF